MAAANAMRKACGVAVACLLIGLAMRASAQDAHSESQLIASASAERGGLRPLAGPSVGMSGGLDGFALDASYAHVYGSSFLVGVGGTWAVPFPDELPNTPFGSGFGANLQLSFPISHTIYVRPTIQPESAPDCPDTTEPSAAGVTEPSAAGHPQVTDDFNYAWTVVLRGETSYQAVQFVRGDRLVTSTAGTALVQLAVAWNAYRSWLVAARAGYAHVVEAPGAPQCAPGTGGDNCSLVRSAPLAPADEIFAGLETRLALANILGLAVRGVWHLALPGASYDRIEVVGSIFLRVGNLSLGLSPGLTYDTTTSTTVGQFDAFVGGTFEVIDFGAS